MFACAPNPARELSTTACELRRTPLGTIITAVISKIKVKIKVLKKRKLQTKTLGIIIVVIKMPHWNDSNNDLFLQLNGHSRTNSVFVGPFLKDRKNCVLQWS